MDEFPDLATLGDPELKRLIDELQEQELEVSFERRMIQGRIDILRAGGLEAGGGSDEALKAAIAAALSGKQSGVEPTPEAREQIAELERQEHEISFRRRMLHGRIDILRAELVARLERSGGASVLGEVDLDRLASILADKGAPPT